MCDNTNTHWFLLRFISHISLIPKASGTGVQHTVNYMYSVTWELIFRLNNSQIFIHLDTEQLLAQSRLREHEFCASYQAVGLVPTIRKSHLAARD